jgi:uncharacterized membrane protein YdjX (TVP38/TMEM64 family)
MPHDQASVKRWLPLVALACLIVLTYALGLQKHLSLQTVVDNRTALSGFVASNLAVALTLYAVIYIIIVSLSLPGAGLLSILGGFVFGWALSAPVTIIAATIGAVIVFQIVKTSIGAAIAERAGPFVKRLSDGFSNDAFNYLLFLRLVPAFPFFAVNAVAGLSRVTLKTFALATLIGIIPGSYAFAWLGRGMGSVIDAQQSQQATCIAAKSLAKCPLEFSVSSLVTRELLIAFVILGLVALIPVALKKWRKS